MMVMRRSPDSTLCGLYAKGMKTKKERCMERWYMNFSRCKISPEVESYGVLPSYGYAHDSRVGAVVQHACASNAARFARAPPLLQIVLNPSGIVLSPFGVTF